MGPRLILPGRVAGPAFASCLNLSGWWLRQILVRPSMASQPGDWHL